MAEEPMSMPNMLTSFFKNDEKNKPMDDMVTLYRQARMYDNWLSWRPSEDYI